METIDKMLEKLSYSKFRSSFKISKKLKGHPVFLAQHATATCCRSCLNKWYKIPQNRKLTDEEIDYIVSIILKWIKMQMNLDLK